MSTYQRLRYPPGIDRGIDKRLRIAGQNQVLRSRFGLGMYDADAGNGLLKRRLRKARRGHGRRMDTKDHNDHKGDHAEEQKDTSRKDSLRAHSFNWVGSGYRLCYGVGLCLRHCCRLTWSNIGSHCVALWFKHGLVAPPQSLGWVVFRTASVQTENRGNEYQCGNRGADKTADDRAA